MTGISIIDNLLGAISITLVIAFVLWVVLEWADDLHDSGGN